MRDQDAPSRSLHEDCWQLLPWQVTGRLSASDAQRVERHLLTCDACRFELEVQRGVCEQIREDDPVMIAPQASLQKLMARIDETVAQPLNDHDALLVRKPARALPTWFAIAAGLQTVAIGVLLVMLWQSHQADLHSPRFTTLSTTSSDVLDEPAVRIVFAPTATTDDINSLLRGIDAEIIAGPTEAGVYTLSLGTERSGERAVQALATIRADRNVKFAELTNLSPP